MNTQLQLDYDKAIEARNKGIERAVAHAEGYNDNWADEAYAFLKGHCERHSEFMVEEVRKAAEGIVPEPPSKRAWGHVVLRAKREGIIARKGYRTTTNVKAHGTPATLWKSLILKY